MIKEKAQRDVVFQIFVRINIARTVNLYTVELDD